MEQSKMTNTRYGLKVFAGLESARGAKQARVLVAATSQQAAAEALRACGLHTTRRTIGQYWSVTGNRRECELAMSMPGAVFASSGIDEDDFVQLPVIPPEQRQPKVPMDPVQRRQKSDAEKIARGEVRLNSWIPPEAAAALAKITSGSEERGIVRDALTRALISFAAQIPG
jgi:hypothetical protein